MSCVKLDPDHGTPADSTDPKPTHSQDGVDLTLIRWMLSLTFEERLRVLQERETTLESLRQGDPPWTSEPS